MKPKRRASASVEETQYLVQPLGSDPDSQSGELAACLPSFDLMTPGLPTLAADGPGKKRGPVTGSLEAAQSWRPKLTGAANRSPLWGSSRLGPVTRRFDLPAPEPSLKV